MNTGVDLYCVMGNPVEHSRSPWIHARFAELTGERLCYERRLVPLGGFADALHHFAATGGRGCNVTVPFKLDAAHIATHRSERVLLARMREMVDVLAKDAGGFRKEALLAAHNMVLFQMNWDA